MPFTVSHLTAVLPLRTRDGLARVLPAAPLAAGAMVPDLPAIVGENWLRSLTHSLPAALTLDVALAAVAVAIWRLGIRPAVSWLAPALAARWDRSPPWRPAAAWWWWWYVAAAVGALTHVVWDAFTHSGEGAAAWFPVLSGHFRLFYLLQLVSSVLGLAYVLVWTRSWWLRTAGRAEGVRLDPARLAAATLAVASAALVGASWRGWLAVHSPGDDRSGSGGALTEVFFGLICGALVGVLVLSASYWVKQAVRTQRQGEEF